MHNYRDQDILDTDFPPVKVTKATRRQMTKYARSHSVRDVRIATGRVYTDSEYEARRERVLSTELP